MKEEIVKPPEDLVNDKDNGDRQGAASVCIRGKATIAYIPLIEQ